MTETTADGDAGVMNNISIMDESGGDFDESHNDDNDASIASKQNLSENESDNNDDKNFEHPDDNQIEDDRLQDDQVHDDEERDDQENDDQENDDDKVHDEKVPDEEVQDDEIPDSKMQDDHAYDNLPDNNDHLDIKSGIVPRKSPKKVAAVRGARHGRGRGAGGGAIEDSLERLAAQRRRLERENEEKMRQLEKLKRKEAEMLEAARRGAPIGDFSIQSDEEDGNPPSYATRRDSGEGEESARGSPAPLDDDDEQLADEEYVTADIASGCEEEEEEGGQSDAPSEDEGSEVAEKRSSRRGSGSPRSNASHPSNGSRNGKRAAGKSPPHGESGGGGEGGQKQRHSRSKISPIKWDKSVSPPAARRGSARRRSEGEAQREPSPPSSEYLAKLKHLFRDTKYFLIKSNNYENVGLAQAKGVWSTPPLNEERLNAAFKGCSNVILIFSVKESGKFQGYARIAAESDRNHPPIRWVLPVGISARALNGVFTIDWVNRQELSFGKTMYIRNSWNFDQAVKIGRDGQEIDPKSGEELCRLFPADKRIDISAIVQKAKSTFKKRGLNKEEFERAEKAREHARKLERPPAR